MRKNDLDYFDERFCNIETKLSSMHDDVLVLKTEWKIAKKTVFGIASGASILISALVNFMLK